MHILYTFLCTAEHTSTSVIATLLSDDDDGAARAVLRSLHPVLYTQDDRVFWYHASFPDFIFDPAQSNFRIGEEAFEFSCPEPAHHNLLSESCFHVMNSRLRFNIANIKSSFFLDRDNSTLPDAVKQNIPPILSYSCRNWDHHVSSVASANSNALCETLSNFLQLRVLFWIEAMNLLNSRGLCDQMLKRVRKWVTNVSDIVTECFMINKW